jgi:hypothetical protein
MEKKKSKECLWCGEIIPGDSKFSKFCSEKCYQKQYRIKNKKSIVEYRKQHYNDNRESILEKKKQYQKDNKESIIEYQKQYLEDNKEKIAERAKQYRKDNKESIAEKKKQYYKDNKDSRNKYQNDRKKNDPIYKLRAYTSSAFYQFLKNNNLSKNGKSTLKFVDYTLEELWEHLESLFVPGMTKKNYGKVWHLDHKKPLISFSIKSLDDPKIKIAWELSNLQPLFWWENLEKKDKLDWVRDPPEIIAEKLKEYLKNNSL